MPLVISWRNPFKSIARAGATDAQSGATDASPRPAADTFAIAPARTQPPAIPVWAGRPGPLRTATEPVRQLIPGHNERHAMRQTLHQKIYAATEMSVGKQAGSIEAWREIIELCTILNISVESQLRRCGGKQPILEKLLDARDFGALGALCDVLPHGLQQGRVHVSKNNGCNYIGEIETYYKDGYKRIRAHGYGHSANNGIIRHGQFHKDVLSGTHCAWYNQEKRIEGAFFNGLVDGYNTCTDTTGVSQGIWKSSKRDGIFRFTGKDGTQKILTYDNGKLLHTYSTSSDGTHYEGEVAGTPPQPHGQGKQIGTDGTVYEGPFQLSKPHGVGAYTFGFETPLFGYRYDGPLVEGKLHGHGTLTNIATGAALPCFHLNNTLKSPMPPSLQFPAEPKPA